MIYYSPSLSSSYGTKMICRRARLYRDLAPNRRRLIFPAHKQTYRASPHHLHAEDFVALTSPHDAIADLHAFCETFAAYDNATSLDLKVLDDGSYGFLRDSRSTCCSRRRIGSVSSRPWSKVTVTSTPRAW